MTDQQTVDRRWLQAAVDVSRLCPTSDTAYAVGAIVVGRDGTELARGYSRETGPSVHAEQQALAKLDGAALGLSGATMYSSLEPCTTRRSFHRTCTELIIEARIRRVVVAMREPPVFADCVGIELLWEAGIEVTVMSEFAGQVNAINAAVLDTGTARERGGDAHAHTDRRVVTAPACRDDHNS
ncbi:deaminase [Plantactinospora solaniradicis]|uniref:Deaminase n=1 Tax=Plantactinospora solaniradicis TaxID=1723736 RepID=A0ABW1KKM1_9ACTN